jgi:sulfite reductase alpha subunit-like flavoprotein
MTWNSKHHDFCQRQGMWLATLNLASYTFRRSKADESTEMEIDREQFDRYLREKLDKKYHRTYFKKMVYQLEELSNGAVVILRDYGHGVYKLLVRPISFAIENGKSKPENSLSQNSGNPMFSEDHKKRVLEQQQQDIDTIKSLFDKLGMKWSRDALLKIWRMSGKSVDDVRTAIEHMLTVNTNQSKPIDTAHGWFIGCMQNGWHKLFNHQLTYELPKFSSRLELMSYINCHLNGDGDPVPIPSQ